MAANDLNTVDLRDGDRRVILKRGAAVVAARRRRLRRHAPHARRRSAAAAASAAPAARRRGAGRRRRQARPDQEPDGRHVLRRPQARARSRSSRSARAVNEETDVCIIEAMKVFNDIKAETSAARSPRSWSRTARPSSSAQSLFLVKPAEHESECRVVSGAATTSARSLHCILTTGYSTHVLQDPDRQPRRDRPAHHPRLPRAGHPDGRRLLDGRPRRRVPEAGRPGDLHRRGRRRPRAT